MEDSDPDVVLSSCEYTYSGPMWYVLLFLIIRIIMGFWLNILNISKILNIFNTLSILNILNILYLNFV